ncbi:Homocysteine S-methyltransferase, partial [Clohesyomyces aquaticus]
PIILDGALATYLETLGADISSSLWSASILLTSPSLIQRAHVDYFRAGAHIATTASYQASIPGLLGSKYLNLSEKDAEGIVAKSVELAKSARDKYLLELKTQNENENGGEKEESKKARPLFIAASIGPYGASLANGSEYTGLYPPSTSISSLRTFHASRLSILLSSDIDILACETIPSFPETLALIQLLTSPEYSSSSSATTNTIPIPAWFTFTLSPSDPMCIADGTDLARVVEVLDPESRVVAIGVNCVSDTSALAALQYLSTLTKKPLIVYPNSGEQWNASARSWVGARSEGTYLAEKCVEWWEAGARMIGGCCRTTP